jgi:hypothetical protein
MPTLLALLPGLASALDSQINVVATKQYDAPRLVFDNGSNYRLKLDGAPEEIKMCIYDGSIDGSLGQANPTPLTIKIEDRMLKDDGMRAKYNYVYSLGLGGDKNSGENKRIDFGLDTATPTWHPSWGWIVERNVTHFIGTDYPKYTSLHSATQDIKSRFSCLQYNLKLYPIGASGNPKIAERPVGKVPGDYSGTLYITISKPV